MMFAIGDRVRILRSTEGLPHLRGYYRGMITACVPEKAGYMVRPDGLESSFGWGSSELEFLKEADDVLPKPVPTVWERLLEDLG